VRPKIAAIARDKGISETDVIRNIL